MDFILIKNTNGFTFVEDKFVWMLDKEEVSYADVLAAVENGTAFDSLSVSTYDEQPIRFEFANGTWYMEVEISAITNPRKATNGKHLAFVNVYATNEDEICDEFEISGPLVENNEYIITDGIEEAFKMLGDVFNMLLTKLEQYCPEDEDEE